MAEWVREIEAIVRIVSVLVISESLAPQLEEAVGDGRIARTRQKGGSLELRFRGFSGYGAGYVEEADAR